MRKLALFVIAVVAMTGPLSAQEPASAQDLFHHALELHDAGDYDGAIAIYRQLLTTMPENEQVKYELTFSTFSKGDSAETIRLATAGANAKGPYQVRYLELLGNAYDAQHQTPQAIAAYKRGIKLEPNYSRIHFNLGIAYSGMNKLRDAREEFERAIEIDPAYASPQYAIAGIYRLDGYRVPSILAYGRFLSLAPTGDRAVTAATNLQSLVTQGVKTEGNGNVNITIDAGSKKDLGDFSALEMMLGIAAGSSHIKDEAPKSEFDRQADTFAVFLTMLSEVAGDFRRGFVAKTYIPFYSAMVKAGHSSTFAHVALAPLNLDGTQQWMSAHQSEVSSLTDWLKSGAH
jgi:tetratricopeptide (TPR) repeat protein